MSSSKSPFTSKRSTVGSLAKLIRTAGNSGIRTGHVLYKDQKFKLIQFDDNDASTTRDLEKISDQSSKEKNVTARLTELYEDQALCDLTLKIGSTTLNIHKLALSRFSEKYLEIFNESSADPVTEIVLPTDVNVESAKEVVRFLYEESVRLRDENIVDILKISVQLGIDKLIDKCVEIMRKCQPEKIMHFLVVCRHLQLDVARKSMIELAANNFDVVVKSQEFPQVEVEDFEDILST